MYVSSRWCLFYAWLLSMCTFLMSTFKNDCLDWNLSTSSCASVDPDICPNNHMFWTWACGWLLLTWMIRMEDPVHTLEWWFHTLKFQTNQKDNHIKVFKRNYSHVNSIRKYIIYGCCEAQWALATKLSIYRGKYNRSLLVGPFLAGAIVSSFYAYLFRGWDARRT